MFRRKPLAEFWREPPIRSSDLAVLHQYGIGCVTRDDGPGMMRTGWALWGLGGIDGYQAFDFLSDGYKLWIKENPSAEIRLQFLDDMFGRLSANPVYPRDVYSVPPEQMQPIATHYGARCWTGSELLELLDSVDHPRSSEYEDRVFQATVAAHPAFVPPRSMAQARSYAEARGLPDPFPVS